MKGTAHGAAIRAWLSRVVCCLKNSRPFAVHNPKAATNAGNSNPSCVVLSFCECKGEEGILSISGAQPRRSVQQRCHCAAHQTCWSMCTQLSPASAMPPPVAFAAVMNACHCHCHTIAPAKRTALAHCRLQHPICATSLPVVPSHQQITTPRCCSTNKHAGQRQGPHSSRIVPVMLLGHQSAAAGS